MQNFITFISKSRKIIVVALSLPLHQSYLHCTHVYYEDLGIFSSITRLQTARDSYDDIQLTNTEINLPSRGVCNKIGVVLLADCRSYSILNQ